MATKLYHFIGNTKSKLFAFIYLVSKIMIKMQSFKVIADI